MLMRVSTVSTISTPASSSNDYVSVLINKSPQTRTVRIAPPAGEAFRASVLYANKGGSVNGAEVMISTEESVVLHWQTHADGARDRTEVLWIRNVKSGESTLF